MAFSRLARWAFLCPILPAVFAHPLDSQAFELMARDGLPNTDFSWVKSFVALGDSYAAGIGIGELTGDSDASACSRYTGAYGLKMKDIIQPNSFQFLACSGDLGKDVVSKQLPKLQPVYFSLTPAQHDLITVSAGGNDVGFSDVLEACLFLPKPPSACTDALTAAETFIDTNLQSVVVSLLNALEPRVTNNGAIVYTLYGKFFNETPDPCNSQEWCFLNPTVSGCQKVTVELRQEFNRLVGKTNDRIVDTITQWNGQKNFKKAYPAHWGGIAMGMGGQFCNPDSADLVTDHSNDGLAFIRPSINQNFDIPGEKRDFDLDNETIGYGWKRDGGIIPDAILQNFHPTDLGAWIQASTALDMVAQHWADFNNMGGPDDSEACNMDFNADSNSTSYTCAVEVDDRTGTSCSCTPQGCQVGTSGCFAVVMTKGQDGCDDSCNGCQVPAQAQPSATTAAPAPAPSTPAPSPVDDPNRPQNLICYGPGTPNSLISFDRSTATDPISKFCNAWIGDAEYSVTHTGSAQFFPLDGKIQDDSTDLLQIEGTVKDYDSAKGGSSDETAATIAACIAGLMAIMDSCDTTTTSAKWGGVGLWHGQQLSLAGDTKATTLPVGEK
ncbi:SGNH hydrolase [Lophium mytilinum]|uniref:SGNH hydrolase n=1 Tax=Lophium mytilinum TaxID=390894 RepID=A0A6A6Q8K0_9PEZI|nr:SGNH hydrolase [Lophium mytilinum]